MSYHFEKEASVQSFFCSFKDGFNNATNIASRILQISVYLDIWQRTFYVKPWLICLFTFLAGSESLVALSCSDHLVMVFLFVSPM